MLNRSKKIAQYYNDSMLFKDLDHRDINMIVLHHTQCFDIDDAILMYKKYGVSVHYVIDENGEIFLLVEEKDIAYHAGFSYWNGFNSLNKISIGIELLSKDPWQIGFSDPQIKALVKLCGKIKSRYKIKNQNIVAHSDVAYFEKDGLLGRKQDPSYLLDWKFLAENEIGFFPKVTINNDKILFKKDQKDVAISKIKQNLHKFGYLVNNFDNNFDEEMARICHVFNQRFNKENFLLDSNCWYYSSDVKLNELLKCCFS